MLPENSVRSIAFEKNGEKVSFVLFRVPNNALLFSCKDTHGTIVDILLSQEECDKLAEFISRT